MKRIVLCFSVFILSIGFLNSGRVWAADDNTKVLKDAITGAVTGATATALTNASPSPTPVNTAEVEKEHKKHHHGDRDKDEDRAGKKHHKKNFEHKDKRPHGWDQGKKTGWDGGNVPPGQRKKN